jgi:hypothetical protein
LATVTGNGQLNVASLQGILVRGATPIAVGDAAGSRTQTSFGNIENNLSDQVTAPIMFLDSPATTSSTTYKIQVRSTAAAETVVINRSFGDTNAVSQARGISTITVMEISA